MFNERAVCQAIIDCCCELHWPASRLRIQVLDDSTDQVTRELVDEKVAEWKERGIDVECLRRTNRQGYKAGAMREGMDRLISDGYLYVAVFDADFKPEPTFLERTIPYLEANPTLGYVQGRWIFTNPQESYLTKAQEISLNYHMKCEQYTHSAYGSFFNFNGTAGVWRCACIESAGGWLSRTTVEDMDLSLRAFMQGWKAVFLDDVTVLNELPASFFAYRKQQHRWTCGPIQLWTRSASGIWHAKVSTFRKLELIIVYFGIRKCATHFVSLGLFCTLVPLTLFSPEIHLPMWALIHVPVAVTLTTAAFTPRGWLYSIMYVLFENAMGTVKLWAVVTGLLDLQRAQEWVVTTKLGSSDKRPGTQSAGVVVPSCRLYVNELGFAIWTLSTGVYGILAGVRTGMAVYLVIQGLVFLAFGLNWVDVGGPLGGRLGEDVVRVPVRADGTAIGSKKTNSRAAYALPVISLPGAGAAGGAEDALNAARRTASVAAPEGVARRAAEAAGVVAPSIADKTAGLPRTSTSNGSVSVLETYHVGSSGSPTSSGSRTPESDDARATAPAAGSQGLAAKLGVRWDSPDSTLGGAFAPAARSGFRLLGSLAGATPAKADGHHDD